jgi:hypothetical protein
LKKLRIKEIRIGFDAKQEYDRFAARLMAEGLHGVLKKLKQHRHLQRRAVAYIPAVIKTSCPV